MSKRVLTLTCKSIVILTNAINQTTNYLSQYSIDTDNIAFGMGENGKYFACLTYECSELDNYFRHSVYELDYSDIKESKISNYDDFIDPEYGEEDIGILEEEMDRENKEREGKNEAGRVINPLAKELLTSTGNSIDLTENLMNKYGGKGLNQKTNISPGRPNMNPRRPGMKWDI